MFEATRDCVHTDRQDIGYLVWRQILNKVVYGLATGCCILVIEQASYSLRQGPGCSCVSR